MRSIREFLSLNRIVRRGVAPLPRRAGFDLAGEDNRRYRCGQAIHWLTEQLAELVAYGERELARSAIVFALKHKILHQVERLGIFLIGISRTIQPLPKLETLFKGQNEIGRASCRERV